MNNANLVCDSIKNVCLYIIKRNNDVPDNLDDYELESYYEKYREDCKDSFTVSVLGRKMFVDNLMKVSDAEFILENLHNLIIE